MPTSLHRNEDPDRWQNTGISFVKLQEKLRQHPYRKKGWWPSNVLNNSSWSLAESLPHTKDHSLLCRGCLDSSALSEKNSTLQF
jgi:hypothetical protein